MFLNGINLTCLRVFFAIAIITGNSDSVPWYGLNNRDVDAASPPRVRAINGSSLSTIGPDTHRKSVEKHETKTPAFMVHKDT